MAGAFSESVGQTYHADEAGDVPLLVEGLQCPAEHDHITIIVILMT